MDLADGLDLVADLGELGEELADSPETFRETLREKIVERLYVWALIVVVGGVAYGLFGPARDVRPDPLPDPMSSKH